MHEHKALLIRFQTFYCCYLTACCVQTSSISSTLELSRIAVPCSLATGQLNSNLPTWAEKFESAEKDWTTWVWGTVERKGGGLSWSSDPPVPLPCLTSNIPATSVPNVTQPVTVKLTEMVTGSGQTPTQTLWSQMQQTLSPSSTGYWLW